jgi:hypothetical protein
MEITTAAKCLADRHRTTTAKRRNPRASDVERVEDDYFRLNRCPREFRP